MQTPNFTPGPWSADKWAPGYTVSAPESHFSICHLQDCNNEEANARLIAAAPALYAASLAAYDAIVRLHDDDHAYLYECDCSAAVAFREVRDALALVDSPDATTGAEIASRL